MANENAGFSSSVRDVAEKSVEQARGAVDTLLQAAQKTAESIQSTTRTAEIPAGQAVARGFGFAQQNISAIFDFAQQLVRASDLKEATQLQTDFVRDQAAIMEKQVAELKSLGGSPEQGESETRSG